LSPLKESSVPSPDSYLALGRDCNPKRLEIPAVYNRASDDLYETDEEAFALFLRCDGTRRASELHFKRSLLDWCLREGIIEERTRKTRRRFVVEEAPAPSLRYLELQVTDRCNLRCRHCYLGGPGNRDLALQTITTCLGEFERMQGLRLLISGGEPLLHPDFWSLNRLLPSFGFRSVLLSNATLINRGVAARLSVHEVQVSLDGYEQSHDLLRGQGTFSQTLGAIAALQKRGIAVSVATMVHAGNRRDFPRLRRLLRELGIREWNIDVPCLEGRLLENRSLALSYEEAAPYLKYAYGGGFHGSPPGYACGAHLAAVTAAGNVAKCAFFGSRPAGSVGEGLRTCWERMRHLKLEDLRCACDQVAACRGGCRYRALLDKDIGAPDPVQCALRGVAPSVAR